MSTFVCSMSLTTLVGSFCSFLDGSFLDGSFLDGPYLTFCVECSCVLLWTGGGPDGDSCGFLSVGNAVFDAAGKVGIGQPHYFYRACTKCGGSGVVEKK